MRLTEEFLKQRKACKEGIEFAKNYGLIGSDLNHIDEVKGDYNNFVSWLKNEVKSEKKYDKNGNLIYSKDSDGYWKESKYDENNNLIYFKNSDGYWKESNYDENNN